MLNAFRTFDEDQNGFITYEQFRQAVGKDGMNLSLHPEDVRDLIVACDTKGTGVVSYKSFLRALASKDISEDYVRRLKAHPTGCARLLL